MRKKIDVVAKKDALDGNINIARVQIVLWYQHYQFCRTPVNARLLIQFFRYETNLSGPRRLHQSCTYKEKGYL